MNNKKSPSLLLVVLAFAAVYIVWGSTYFFIEMAVKHIAPTLLGAIRFIAAGIILLVWVISKREKIWRMNAIIPAAISGFLMLFLGNGSVIWAEQFLASSFVAIFIASSPIWFLVLDKPNWKENFRNKFTLAGVFMGIAGVVFLFYEKLSSASGSQSFWPLLAILIGNIGWVTGSLYSKYKTTSVSVSVNAAWQMLSAGVIFAIISTIDKSVFTTNWSLIPLSAWLALIYLIVFGSIIGYSAYVFLLDVRSATQVSTYAYVNPLVAVLLGVFINRDHLTVLQLTGLAVILCSVFFINLAKKERKKIQAGLYKDAEAV